MRQLFRGTLLQQFAVASFVSIAIIGIILAIILSRVIEAQALDELATEARDTLATRVIHNLTPEDFANPMAGQRYADFQHFVEDSVLSARTARIKIWNKEGVVIYSDDTTLVGQKFPVVGELQRALAGETVSEFTDLRKAENVAERRYGVLLEVYTPVVFPGSTEIVGAFEIYQSYAPVEQHIRTAHQHMYAGVAGGLAILYLTLFAIVKRGSDTLLKQQSNLARSAADLEESYRATITAINTALDLRDSAVEAHSYRVSQLALAVAKQMGVPQERWKDMEYGALLHDVGKIGVSDAILRKPGPLTPEEWEEMKKHPRLGHEMLLPVSFLREACPIVLHHHEKYDGSGYPDSLAGDQIPLGARIFAVVDAYDAMTSARPYRKARPHQVAIDEIIRLAGKQFDPQAVEAFLSYWSRQLALREAVSVGTDGALGT